MQDELLKYYPNITPSTIKRILKYQNKFNFTIDNLKCLNPSCNQIRSWKDSVIGFNKWCSKECLNKLQPSLVLESIQKRSDTYFKKTGYKNPSFNPKVIKLKKDNFIKKYGVTCSFNIPEVKLKIKEIFLKRYNHPSFLGSNEYKDFLKTIKHYTKQHINNLEYWNNKEFWVKNFINDNNNLELTKAMQFFNCSQTSIHKQLKIMDISYSKLGGTSLKEQFIIQYLKQDCNLIIEPNRRDIISPLELDIYLPKLNLAIEFNGLYWHSYHETIGTSPKQLDLNYMKYRHYNKTKLCLKAGIRLLHIYEDDMNSNIWFYKLEKFLLYKPGMEVDFECGCYPLDLDPNLLPEPKPNIVLENRILYK